MKVLWFHLKRVVVLGRGKGVCAFHALLTRIILYAYRSQEGGRMPARGRTSNTNPLHKIPTIAVATFYRWAASKLSQYVRYALQPATYRSVAIPPVVPTKGRNGGDHEEQTLDSGNIFCGPIAPQSDVDRPLFTRGIPQFVVHGSGRVQPGMPQYFLLKPRVSSLSTFPSMYLAATPDSHPHPPCSSFVSP